MKRVNNLYSKICELDNLYLAFNKAKKGKSAKHSIKNFEKHLEQNLLKLQNDLINHNYKTSNYDIFVINDPKERIVYRLPFKDRIVHHAIMNVLESIWLKTFTTDSYSSIKHKGIHNLLYKLKKDLKETNETEYCLKLDIKKFYPSINHDILKNIIRKKIKDNDLLSVLDEIIDSAPGIPIGNYLSQFFANLYLTYFDHWIKEEIKVKYYYRYADDIVVLSNDKKYLRDLLSQIALYLSVNLKLTVKQNYQIFPVDKRGIDFIGYVFFHSHIKIRKRIKKHFCKFMIRINKNANNIESKEYKILIAPWVGWLTHCNSKNLVNKYIINEKVF